jgi:FkbM family methyltransferase
MSNKINPTWDDVMKFSLNVNPIIFDVGGYKGDFVKICLDKYDNPLIYVFEPVTQFYEIIKERYADNPNIKVYNFGLSDENRIEYISEGADASSVFIGIGTVEIKLKDIREFLFEENLFNVDLIKINIEGEEYRLLEYLVNTPELNIFKNFLIQFHDFIDGCVDKRNKILNESLKYYNRIFNYEFIFEGWTMKSVQNIKCLGDSHISIFTNSDTLIKENQYHNFESFSAYRFGPYLAYNIVNKPTVLEVINKIDNSENLLISFGEIDCRSQVKKITEETNTDYTIIIDDILKQYTGFIDSLNNKNIILSSVVPELKEKPFRYYYEEHPDDFDCPRGTYKERRMYKEYFNEKLKEYAISKNYKFIDFYQYIVNEFDTKEVYYLDDIHLKSTSVNYLIKRELIKVGLIL